MKRLLTTCLILTASVQQSHAASRSDDLESWFKGDLVPHVRQQLATLPRFRGESFRFVIMSGESPQSEGSALALGLRDRLRDAVADVAGIRVAWQGDQPGVGLTAGATGLDCTKNEANYFVGIEVQELAPGQVDISIGTLDIEERAWVPGVARSWRGSLNSRQRRELLTISGDPTFRGERGAPWDDTETDLMAAHLAYELGCQLLRQTAGEFVVAANNIEGDVDATTALVELVGNNLAGIRALQFAASDTNAVIGGKAHRIDDDLFQYWVTITPTGDDAGMTALSADAYVRIPDQYKAATLVPDAIYHMSGNPDGFLSSLSVVRLRDPQSCVGAPRVYSDMSSTRSRYASSDCYALQLRASNDAVVFFLNHQLNFGLVRLSDTGCARQSMARIARTGQELRQPLHALQSGTWSAADSWSLSPRADTYYVLAAKDTRAARALSRHIEALPQRCSASVRPGLEGATLRRWLQELEQIADHYAPAIDWRSIRVKDVY